MSQINMNGNRLIIFIYIIFVTTIYAEQPDTLKIIRVDTTPVFDGTANDAVWNKTEWISIDQAWMTWGGKIIASDFSGRFKVLWSEKANLLYFVAEITDDVFRDGYVFKGKKNQNYSD